MIEAQTRKIRSLAIKQFSVVVSFLLLSSICFQSVLAQSTGDFTLSTGSYPETANLEKIIKDRYGPGAKIADWSDIKSQFSNSEIDDWADRIGLDHEGKAWVQWNGSRWHSGSDRHYFVKRHDGDKSGNFLAHDDIGGHIISLGSWYGQRNRVLVDLRGVRSNENPKRYELTTGKYPETADLKEIVRNQYGPSAEVADWSDVKSQFSSSEIDDWADRIGLDHEGKAWVQWNGRRWHSGSDRHYFVKRHDGDKSGNFLAHDDIGGHIISLGSWYGQRNRVLVDLRDVDR